ncbi:hypothetical protein [Chryseobacterium sp. JUb7]|uniref:hypothetical protein n=1 Tax=Chryseobacterium sp. JUb7 TaxID=2940599 RepID=UPI002168E44E|nr:hypothetical protein [Chryseobacterium sp. JUb7]MCS3529771.1 hypothetical protein [Chryseobacterium sp. JUb7]
MIVHFILSGETLESISEEIQLENPKYLKEYHNQRCAREDYIHDRLVPRKKLLIPGIKEINEYNNRNDAPFKALKLNPALVFNPENLDMKYFVEIIESAEREGENIGRNFITYTAHIKWIGKDGDHHIFELSKTNFFNMDGSKMADLARECMNFIYPMLIYTNLQGEVMKIEVLDEILNDFNDKKEKLFDLFPDKYAGIYIEEFEFIVRDKELFDRRMKEDSFIKAYFAAIRNKFINGKSFFYQTIGEENLSVHIQQTVSNDQYSDEIVLFQGLNSLEKDISYSGNYSLYTENSVINKVEIDYFISRYSVENKTKIIIKHLS